MDITFFRQCHHQVDGEQPVYGKGSPAHDVGLLDRTDFNRERNNYPFAIQKKSVTSIRQIFSEEDYPYVTLELNGRTT